MPCRPGLMSVSVTPLHSLLCPSLPDMAIGYEYGRRDGVVSDDQERAQRHDGAAMDV